MQLKKLKFYIRNVSICDGGGEILEKAFKACCNVSVIEGFKNMLDSP